MRPSLYSTTIYFPIPHFTSLPFTSLPFHIYEFKLNVFSLLNFKRVIKIYFKIETGVNILLQVLNTVFETSLCFERETWVMRKSDREDENPYTRFITS
jgi:hypothetical protein